MKHDPLKTLTRRLFRDSRPRMQAADKAMQSLIDESLASLASTTEDDDKALRLYEASRWLRRLVRKHYRR